MHELVGALRGTATAERWRDAAEPLMTWAGSSPRALEHIRDYLHRLSATDRAALVGRSRETATHFAWCVVDETRDPFSLWVHEYKASHRWPATYANSVHNHRYDFCTRILSGGYRHQHYDAVLDPSTGLPCNVVLRSDREVTEGHVLTIPAEMFHRVPTARRGTLTLLVKFRARYPHSVSYDPMIGASNVHIPIESRLDHLITALLPGGVRHPAAEIEVG